MEMDERAFALLRVSDQVAKHNNGRMGNQIFRRVKINFKPSGYS